MLPVVFKSCLDYIIGLKFNYGISSFLDPGWVNGSFFAGNYGVIICF